MKHLTYCILLAGLFVSSCGFLSKIRTWSKSVESGNPEASSVESDETAKTSPLPEETAPGTTEIKILRIPHESASFRDAAAWNDAGFEDYETGDFTAAAEDFRKAILAESTYLYPHFNLACVLALSAEEGSEEQEECFRELEICLGLDPVRLGQEADWFMKKLQTDPDLESVRNTSRFKEIQEKGMISFSPKELIIGEWTNWNTSLVFKEDGTYVYEIDRDNALRRSRGSWEYDPGRNAIIISNDEQGDSLRISYYDPELEQDVTELAGNLEWALGDFEIRMYRRDNPFYPHTILQKNYLPLHQAIKDSDRSTTAALLALGIFPDKEDDDWNTPLDLLAAKGDLSMLRMYLGRDGVYVNNRFHHDSSGISTTAKNMIMTKKEQENEDLISETEANSRYNREWYARLLENGIHPSFEKNAPAMGWGSGNSLHPLGHHLFYFAFIDTTYISAMPGEIYSLVVMDGRDGEWIKNEHLADSILLEEESPYNAMTYHYAITRRLMELEDQWIPLLRNYGIEPSTDSLQLKSLPCSIGGHTYDLDILPVYPDEEEEDWQNEDLSGFETFESRYQLRFMIDDDLSPFSGTREITCMSVSTLGYFPVRDGNTVVALLVFLQLRSWGFEGETDSWITTETFLLNDY